MGNGLVSKIHAECPLGGPNGVESLWDESKWVIP